MNRMKDLRTISRAAAVAAVFLAALALPFTLLVAAPRTDDPTSEGSGDVKLTDRQGTHGVEALRVPARTDAGDFYGTWYYVSRDEHIAMWIRRDDDGAPSIRVRYQAVSTPESFETDWEGAADYFKWGNPARFEMRLTERDDDLIRGTWQWDAEHELQEDREKGKFRFYRSSDGRGAVLLFDELERYTREGDRERTQDVALALTFLKASRRLVLWDELPW